MPGLNSGGALAVPPNYVDPRTWTQQGAYPNAFQPVDHNLIAWSYDPAVPSAGSAPATGTVQLIAIPIRVPALVTNIFVHVSTGGSVLTAGQNFAGLYDTGGNLLAVTADQTVPWASTGLKTMPLTAPPLISNDVYVALVSNGTTAPTLARGGGLTGEAGLINVGLTAATARFATGPAAQTSLPAAITMSGLALATVGFWTALG